MGAAAVRAAPAAVPDPVPEGQMASGGPGRYAGGEPRFPVARSVVIPRDPEGALAPPGRPRVRIHSLAMRAMSRSRLQLSLVLTALALTPAIGVAQGAAQTHTVKKGDTLWDLAQQYLGDPFRWPEIYRRNTETVKDPNLIYPDQVLVIAGDVAATPGTPADVVAPRDSAAMAAAAAGAMPPALPPAMPTDTMASLPTAGGGPAMPQQAYVPKPMTIFNPDRFKTEARGPRESLALIGRPSAVRPGDYLRAPFMWDPNGMTGSGQVGDVIRNDAIGKVIGNRPVQIYERLFVTVPTGAAGVAGEQFLSYRMGPTIPDAGVVIVPTGVVKLLGAPENGRAEALLLTKFEEVYGGQGLMAVDTLAMPDGVFPSRVEFGTQTSLAWVYDEPVLPSIGQHLILRATTTDGLVTGDQVTIQRQLGSDSKGVELPPADVVVVQVTRVTKWGASAIIIGQKDGLLSPGQPARVTAKMP